MRQQLIVAFAIVFCTWVGLFLGMDPFGAVLVAGASMLAAHWVRKGRTSRPKG